MGRSKKKKRGWWRKPQTTGYSPGAAYDPITGTETVSTSATANTYADKLESYSRLWPVVRPKMVFKVGNTAFWGGPADMMRYSPYKLLVVASQREDLYRPQAKVLLSPEARDLISPALVSPACPWVELQWDDMGAPRLDAQWWQAFAADLLKIDGNVGCCCHGGSGRTGTMLSILAALTGAAQLGEDPVKFVRMNYHEDAVETLRQFDYIEQITGRIILEEVWSTRVYEPKRPLATDNSSATGYVKGPNGNYVSLKSNSPRPYNSAINDDEAAMIRRSM